MKTLLASLAAFAVLAANAAVAGSLAPAPRVVAKYERDFIERSGSLTLQELLDTGIIRYLLTGGQSLMVMIDGRPYSSTGGLLETLPLSAIERIELLGGDGLGIEGGRSVRGALNIVLRTDLDGVHVRTVGRVPSQGGGEGWQGSAFWGGAVGEGRMTVGADVLRRQEIPSRSREYSRSRWTQGGSFRDADNVSFGGNTLWVVRRGDDGEFMDERSVSLGDCDPAHGYTRPLSNPPGIGSGDEGCGFAYGNIAWNTPTYDQNAAVLNLDHPLGETAELHVDARVLRAESAFRYAPSVGVFDITPNEDLLRAINVKAAEAGGGAFEADDNDLFTAAHRFVRHGNRDWLTEFQEYDLSIGVEGRLTETLGYDVSFNAYALDAFQGGDTFVHRGRIAAEIAAGRYDIANPFSDAAAHLEAIENSSLELENDFGESLLSARLALEGSAFAIGGRDVAWTAGIQLARVKAEDNTVYRADDGSTHELEEVLGSGGFNFTGERKTAGAFADVFLPLAETVDLRVAGRADEYDDIGRLTSWRLAAAYRPADIVTLRGSWSEGDTAPGMVSLHAEEVEGYPYISCDPGPGEPPRECAAPNARQVRRLTSGNPELDPATSRRVAVGAEARRGPFFLGVEWYRLARDGLVGQNTADWAMRELEVCEGDERSDCIERVGGAITIHDSYANIVETETTGINTRFGGGFRTGWGVVGMRGVWRRVTGTERRVAGIEQPFDLPQDVVRVGFLARRGGISATWIANYRAGYDNRAGTGAFDSWTGHDLVLDWNGPLGFDGARVTAGVFNLTDESLSADSSNSASVDGPTEADWGRTFFVTLNLRF